MSVLDDLRKAKAEAAPDLRGARRQARQDPPRVDRLPPHSPEAEQGVLGCILLSPNESLGECVGKFKSGGEVFYDLRHQTIYAALIEMCDERQAIDLITLPVRSVDSLNSSPPCTTLWPIPPIWSFEDMTPCRLSVKRSTMIEMAE